MMDARPSTSEFGEPMDHPICARMPNVARVYDFLLGGKDNFEADRKAAKQLLDAVPDAAVAAWDNRQFLGRAVEFLVREAGIRQFIDIGTGLPTRGNVHAVAHHIAPDAHVAYVDNDPAVIAHSNALLSGHVNVATIVGDARDPRGIIADAALRSLIDFERPLALLLVAVLHFIKDAEDPHGSVNYLKSVIVPGSYLVISHVTDDHVSLETAARVRELYEEANAPGVARSRREIARFFKGLEMVPPGLVDVARWRSEWMTAEPGRTLFYAGAGIKR